VTPGACSSERVAPMDEVATMNVPEDPSQTERRDLARAQSLARFHRMLSKRGEARRWRFEIIQGTARNVTYHPVDAKTTIEVSGQPIQLAAPNGDPIAVSEGDSVLIAARVGDPGCASVYFNETTGGGSINSAYNADGRGGCSVIRVRGVSQLCWHGGELRSFAENPLRAKPSP
jgi:uncharacterized protein YjlB